MALILVVDDEPDARRLLAKVLQRAGHEAVTADGGLEALQVVKTRKPDLVLLDISMPQVDGFDVLETLPRIPGDGPDPPVVMVTAFSDGPRRERARQLGASDYFVKGSYDVRALLDRIEQLVA